MLSKPAVLSSTALSSADHPSSKHSLPPSVSYSSPAFPSASLSATSQYLRHPPLLNLSHPRGPRPHLKLSPQMHHFLQDTDNSQVRQKHLRLNGSKCLLALMCALPFSPSPGPYHRHCPPSAAKPQPGGRP